MLGLRSSPIDCFQVPATVNNVTSGGVNYDGGIDETISPSGFTDIYAADVKALTKSYSLTHASAQASTPAPVTGRRRFLLDQDQYVRRRFGLPPAVGKDLVPSLRRIRSPSRGCAISK